MITLTPAMLDALRLPLLVAHGQTLRPSALRLDSPATPALVSTGLVEKRAGPRRALTSAGAAVVAVDRECRRRGLVVGISVGVDAEAFSVVVSLTAASVLVSHVGSFAFKHEHTTDGVKAHPLSVDPLDVEAAFDLAFAHLAAVASAAAEASGYASAAA